MCCEVEGSSGSRRCPTSLAQVNTRKGKSSLSLSRACCLLLYRAQASSALLGRPDPLLVIISASIVIISALTLWHTLIVNLTSLWGSLHVGAELQPDRVFEGQSVLEPCCWLQALEYVSLEQLKAHALDLGPASS